MTGENINGDMIDARYLLPLGDAGADGVGRLLAAGGIEFRDEDGKVFVDNLTFSGAADQLGIVFDWEPVGLDVKADRIRKEWFYIPVLVLLGFVYLLQMRRKRELDLEEEAVA